ncbi:MAG TPA: di-heme oxidoredictase family protein [Aliidongia sp.]|nr:di-heme oxidoredictase family protein [Aliidongia sp.]
MVGSHSLRIAILATGLVAATDEAAAGEWQGLDPGVRTGPAAAGGPLSGLNPIENGFFLAARARFNEIDSVSGAMPGEAGFGLGPRFNLNSCAGCHAFPAVGGSSPLVNPEIAMATLDGASNAVPSFITPNGPVREVRFVRNPDGTPDGGVHDLFVISGRRDAPGCAIVQPDFNGAVAANNAIFRIPTPVFGLGLVEDTPDSNLVAAKAAGSGLQQSLGIGGHFNMSANDGTITRFGWKAQNKSLMVFAGEAYNVEQGVTNENFPDERETNPNCRYNVTPEDGTVLRVTGSSGSPASDYSSDVVNFAAFARLSAAPTPIPLTATAQMGAQLFMSTGCQGCHIQNQTTGASPYAGYSNATYQPYSDFAVHDMGDRLADGITQGNATGREFRTAPLWGIGQRIFFLHDGRTADLNMAILAHSSRGSEANAVIGNYRRLADQQKRELLVFLRSL